MTKLFSSATVVAVAFMFSFTAKAPHSTNYKLDAKASNVQWFAEKVTVKHNGTVNLSSGVLTDNHGQWTGTFEMDMTSITVSDLEAGKGKEKLEGHLKSPDFFDVEKHKTAKLVISSITPMAEAKDGMTHSVKGFLTIKEKSNPVSFDVALKNEGGKMNCSGSIVIDRSKYDVRYGSKTFFSDIGDKAIMDDFTLKFTVALGM
ncbi:MAG: YceI family protein [Bacteroidetes bacterium]|nr:YceI family protein [Bacteroidota bacterium]